MDCATVPATAALRAVHITCIVNPPFDWHALIAPGVTGLGVVVAIGLALVNVRTARSIARLKATLDLIEKVESSEHYRKRHETFRAVRIGGGFPALENPTDAAATARRYEIVEYLNHYELVALGILNRVLDAAMYRNWMAGPFVRDWNAAAGWIQNERWKLENDGTWSYRAETFGNYQTVARQWSDEAIVLTRDTSSPPISAARRPDGQLGPGDEPLPPTDADHGSSA